MAELRVETEISRLLAHRVAWMQSQDLVPNYEASMAKMFGSDVGQSVARLGANIDGMHGQLGPTSRLLRSMVRCRSAISIRSVLRLGRAPAKSSGTSSRLEGSDFQEVDELSGNTGVVTIQDVAKHAGVSVGTVSRVLNEHPAVRPKVRSAVLSSISELGYRPNSFARDLRRTRTRTLGLMVNDLNNPPSVGLLRGTEDAAREAGYSVIIAESRSDIETESQNLTALLARRVDGLLCVPVHSIDAIAEKADAAGVPLAILSQRSPHRRVPTGFVDENPAIEAALESLVGLGHRRFAMIHPSGAASARARAERVRQYLAGRGISGPSSGQLLWSFSGEGDCEQVATRLLSQPEAPTAVIVGAHHYLPEVLMAARSANMRIPEDVSLVAFGDSSWAAAMSPSISVIAFDQKEQAIETTQMLLAILNGDENAPRSVSSTSVFIQRESCVAPPNVAVPVSPDEVDGRTNSTMAPRVFFDVDDTLLASNHRLRPHAREVIEETAALGFDVYIWSGAGVRWEVVHVHALRPFVVDCYLKPLSRHRESLGELGIEAPPDHVVDDDQEIVRVFGGTHVPAPMEPLSEDRELLRVIPDLRRRFPDFLSNRSRAPSTSP